MDNRHNKWIPRVKRICETCGKEFERRVIEVKNGGGKYCSKTCAKNNKEILSKRVHCICETCGKEFYVSPSVIRQGQGKHCSRICRIKKRKVTNCIECGKPLSKQRKFCSVKCTSQWNSKNKAGEIASNWQGGQIERTCKQCGKKFFVDKCKVNYGEGLFCSRKCTAQHYSSHGKANPNYKRIDVPCKQCGKTVQVTPARYKRTKSIYCSTACRDTWAREHPGKEHHSFTSKYVICVICGKEFKLTKHWEKLGRIKYCSQDCYWKDLPNLIGGPNHPNWIGGSKIYCEKWTVEFRRRIRLFYNHTCVECGTPQNGKLLHCHHIYYDKKACCSINENGVYLSNLGIKGNPYTFEIKGDPNKFVALCNSCHAKSSNKNNREYWARHFEEIVNSYYQGKSYLTKEEYQSLLRDTVS